MDLNYDSLAELLKAAKEQKCRLSRMVLTQQAEQMETDELTLYEKMKENYQVMAACIAPGCDLSLIHISEPTRP